MSEKLTRVSDPFSYLLQLTPTPGSKEEQKRDKYFEIIKPLVINDQFYIPKVRAEYIKQILQGGEISKPYLYRLVRQYWQRGQIQNALLSDYHKSGAKGKKRTTNDIKLGRPRKITSGIGAIIDERTEKLFRIVIDKYLLTEQTFTVAFAHRRLKLLYEQYFPNLSEAEKPTRRQLEYFFNREYSDAHKLISTNAPTTYRKDIRPLHSTAPCKPWGLGHVMR